MAYLNGEEVSIFGIGLKGDDALVFNTVYNGGSVAPTINAELTSQVSNFNRTPLVDDYFVLVYGTDYEGSVFKQTYLLYCIVLSIDTVEQTATFKITQITNLRGEKGEQGDTIEYSAGTGIDITNGTISIDEDYADNQLQLSKDYTDKKARELLFTIGTYDLDVETDDTSSYIKNVPSNALKYATLDMIGGMSYKSENLIDYKSISVYSQAMHGITLTNNNDGSYTLSGTADETINNAYWYMSTNLSWIEQHIGNGYVSMFIPNNTNNVYFGLWTGNTNYNINPTANITATYQSGANFVVRMNIVEGQTYNITFTPMLVKSQTPPTKYQPYFDGIRDTAVRFINSKDTNDNIIATKIIPSAIQQLDGYGWGINSSVYNYIDFDRKVFVKKVGRVKAKDLTWSYITDGTYPIFVSSTITGIKQGTFNVMPNLLFNLYNLMISKGGTQFKASDFNNYYTIRTSASDIMIQDSAYTDGTTFANHFTNNDYLYYELATPIETDISEYIDDNYIEVSSGGIVEFENEHKQDMPNEITYLVEV